MLNCIYDKYNCQYERNNCHKEVNTCQIEEEVMPLTNTLKVQRAKLGINQGELGQLAGVSRQTISSIERGEYNPSITLVLKLAKIFNTTVEEMFEYEEDEIDE